MNENNFLTGALIGVMAYYIITHNKQRMEHHKRKMMMQGLRSRMDMPYDEQDNQQDEQAYQEDNSVVYQDDYGNQEVYLPAYDDNSPHEEAMFPSFFENSYGEVTYYEPQDYYVQPQYVGSVEQPVYIEPQYEYEYSQPSQQQPEVIEAVFVGQPQTQSNVLATTVVPKGLYTEDKYDALKQYNGADVYAVGQNDKVIMRGTLNTDTMTVTNQNPKALIQVADVRQLKTIRLVNGNKFILEPPVKRIKKLAIPDERMLSPNEILNGIKGKSMVKNTELVAPKPVIASAPAPVSAPAPAPEKLLTTKLPSKMTLPKGVRGGSMDLTQLI